VTALPLILLAEDKRERPRDDARGIHEQPNRRIDNESVTVRDGMAALAHLHHRQPLASRSVEDLAVVLLDLELTKVDDLEVLRTIKAGIGHLPVVVLT
jgi:CheY-like chemotaxis protein